MKESLRVDKMPKKMVAAQLSDKVVRRDVYNNNSNYKMAIKTHDDDVWCPLGRPQGKMAEKGWEGKCFN